MAHSLMNEKTMEFESALRVTKPYKFFGILNRSSVKSNYYYYIVIHIFFFKKNPVMVGTRTLSLYLNYLKI